MITAIYDISSFCNYRCIYCRNDWEKQGNSSQPPIEEIKKIIDSICRENFKRIILTGGEFFTIPYWREALSYIKSKGIIIWIVTNAALIKSEDIPFLENQVERINVSFHSADKKMYRQIMGIKDDSIFEKVIENLRLFGKSRIKIGIFYSPLRINYQSLYETIRTLNDLGIKPVHVNLNRITPTQHTIKYFQEEKKLGYFEHKELIEQLVRIRREFQIDISAEAYPVCFLNKFIEDEDLLKQINQPCFLGRKAVAFNNNGSLKICPATDFSIDEKILADFSKCEWRNLVCRKCPYWEICLGGCHTSKGQIYTDDSLLIDDQVEFEEGIDTFFFDLLIKLYKPFLSSAYKKARFQYTILSKHKYKHPVGLIAINRTSAAAHFFEIALIPDLKEKYYTFLTIQNLIKTLPIEKYGWTVHKANYPSITLLERLNGGFYENTIKNTKRIEAEGFFKTRQPAPQKMQAALKQLKPQSEKKFQEWLVEFKTRKKEKQELQKYLEDYTQ